VKQPRPRFHLTDLGTLGGTSSWPTAVNNLGQVVGWAALPDAGGSHAFFWSADTGMLDLGVLGGQLSGATGINDTGEVVGSFQTHKRMWRAFRWNATAGMLPLEPPAGAVIECAVGINNRGQILGSTYLREANLAYLWDPQGGWQDLGRLPSFTDTYPVAINGVGQVCGNAGINPGDVTAVYRAFRWTSGRMEALPLLGSQNSEAAALNDAGHVVGDADDEDGIRAVLWGPAGAVMSLRTLPGYRERTSASGINNRGQIVGSANRIPEYRALLWQEGRMYDLNQCIPPGSGWELRHANAINDQGEIIGVGHILDQPGHWLRGFLLTPVP
jgi:probable HAF family extracellular repeat protein